MTRDESVEELHASEVLNAITRTTLPLAGPWGIAGSVVFEAIGLTMQRRRDVFINELGVRLESLERDHADFKYRVLVNNQAFITAFFQASAAAIRTHQEEKRRALLNGLSNVALGREPEEDLHAVFLGAIDRMTPSHLAALAHLLKNQRQSIEGTWFTDAKGTLESQWPEFLEVPGFAAQVVRDLHTFGLLEAQESTWDYTPYKVGPLGERFLAFIADPTVEKTPK